MPFRIVIGFRDVGSRRAFVCELVSTTKINQEVQLDEKIKNRKVET